MMERPAVKWGRPPIRQRYLRLDRRWKTFHQFRHRMLGVPSTTLILAPQQHEAQTQHDSRCQGSEQKSKRAYAIREKLLKQALSSRIRRVCDDGEPATGDRSRHH